MSHNHLVKVVHDLRKAGFVEAVRRRNGGIRLARPAGDITLGDVVRYAEDRPAPTADRSHDDTFLHEIFEAAFGRFFAELGRNRLTDIAEGHCSGASIKKPLH